MEIKKKTMMSKISNIKYIIWDQVTHIYLVTYPKTYSPKHTTWSTPMTLQSPIAPMNSPQPRWRDVGLPTTQDSNLESFHERLGMVG